MSKIISRFTFLEKRKYRDFDLYDGPYYGSWGAAPENTLSVGTCSGIFIHKILEMPSTSGHSQCFQGRST